MHVITVKAQDLFQSLADFTRVRIVYLLAKTNEEACLCELSDALEEPEYKLSRHVKILRQAGLLSATKEGRWIYHRLVKDQPHLKQLYQVVLSLPDPDDSLLKDLRKFKKRMPLRENGRCRTESKAPAQSKQKVR